MMERSEEKLPIEYPFWESVRIYWRRLKILVFIILGNLLLWFLVIGVVKLSLSTTLMILGGIVSIIIVTIITIPVLIRLIISIRLFLSKLKVADTSAFYHNKPLFRAYLSCLYIFIGLTSGACAAYYVERRCIERIGKKLSISKEHEDKVRDIEMSFEKIMKDLKEIRKAQTDSSLSRK